MATLTIDERKEFQTIVIDSVTSMELAARKQQQYVLNKTAKDPRQWYAGATDRLEEMLCIRFGAVHDINIIILAHIDEEKDEMHGTYVRNPAAPGRLRKRLSAYYNEMYRAYALRAKDGIERWLQTEADAMYTAFSMECKAPNPCTPVYDSLWSSAQRKAADESVLRAAK